MSTDSPACTNACTNLPENGNDSPLELDDVETSKRLELLASNAELASVLEAWPGLPEAIRAGILAMVRAAAG